jgi:hypothetical protein
LPAIAIVDGGDFIHFACISLAAAHNSSLGLVRMALIKRSLIYRHGGPRITLND